MPSFASAPNAETICTGVTPTSCPIAIEPIDDGCQRSTLRRMPFVSPGNSIPVFAPKPKRRIYSYIVGSPTLIPSLIAATLLDLASASGIVNEPNG